MAKRRVVVTGLGMLTPLGNDVASSWQGLQQGKSGISLIEHFDTSAYTTKFAGLVKNFDVEPFFSAKDAKKMDLFIQYGVAAGIQAFRDSGIEITEHNAPRIGAAIGSGISIIPRTRCYLRNDGARLHRISGNRTWLPRWTSPDLPRRIYGR